MDKKERLLLFVPPLLAAFAIALYARMYRVLLWGWWLDEFDPYVRYYLAKYTLEHGARLVVERGALHPVLVPLRR